MYSSGFLEQHFSQGTSSSRSFVHTVHLTLKDDPVFCTTRCLDSNLPWVAEFDDITLPTIKVKLQGLISYMYFLHSFFSGYCPAGSWWCVFAWREENQQNGGERA